MKKMLLLLACLIACNLLMAQQVKKIKITDLEKIIKESKTPLIVNFWATWCAPCVQEIPYFQEETNKHKQDGLQLLLVSLDFREDYPKLSSFMKQKKITAAVSWLDETKADYFCPRIDAKWSGAIPASIFINNKKGYRKFSEAQLSHEELKKEIKAIL